jgi:hypothetical protein
MSARDLARFALLYLHGGKWRGQQVVPADWVHESTESHSQVGDDSGYGYLWWTGSLAGSTVRLPDGSFSAQGAEGQYAFVIPALDLVVVQRIDSDIPQGPEPGQRRSEPTRSQTSRLLWLILSAAGAKDIGADPLADIAVRAPPAVPIAGPHKEIDIDPMILDGYVGKYQFAPSDMATVTRQSDHLFVQLTGRPGFAVFPESARDFFYKLANAQFTFAPDGQGKATELVLHQNGRDRTGKRVDEAEAERLRDALAQRVKDQTAQPGSEAALRSSIDGLQRGQPNYDQMIPAFADATRQQLPRIQSRLASLGQLKSVTFKGVGPGGADIYEVMFANGGLEWRIALAADGKIVGIGMRPLATGAPSSSPAAVPR